MAAAELKAQDIILLTQDSLLGYANAVSSDTLLAFINEAKDEIWTIIKQLKTRHFVTKTQATDPTKDSYFPVLATNTREYSLPSDLRDIVFIEVTGPSGYERTQFTQRAMTHPDFRDARTGATAFNAQGSTAPLSGVSQYFYDMVGKNTFVMAQFPETNFTLVIWYVRALPDMTLGSTLDEIVFPFSKKLADYAAKKVLLSEDSSAFALWQSEWRTDVIAITEGVDRSGADPSYAVDFLG